MKKILLASLAACACATLAQARTFEQARAAAMDFYGLQSPSQLASAAPRQGESQPFYAFSSPRGEGFVIISGNDCMPAVAGYADHGAFDLDSMPPQLTALLQAQANATGCDAGSRGDDDEGVLLNTALFNQYEPFDGKCPPGCPTGCVATAMSIMMKYWEWPPRGRGSHSYQWQGKTLSCDFEAGFDWANMLNNYGDGWTSTQGNAVASLMYAAGVSVEMAYSTYESGAAEVDVPHAMVDNFYYSPDIVLLKKDLYAEAGDWDALLRRELNDGRPVMYSGGPKRGDAVPHIFVIDGYKGDYYHANWGWGGQFNGYYLLTGMDFAGVDYSYAQAAIVNVRPDERRPAYCPLQAQWQYGEGYGLVCSAERVKAGQSFVACVSRLYNSGLDTAQGTLGLALEGSDGHIKEVIATTPVSVDPLCHYFYKTFDYCSPNVSAEQGDKLVLLFRSSEDAEDAWAKVSGDGFVSAELSAWDNQPVTAPVTWDVMQGVSTTVQAQAKNKALAHAVYIFGFNSRIGGDYKVEVNGEEKEPIMVSGSWKYYQHYVDSEETVAIQCYMPDGIDDACAEALQVAVAGRTAVIAGMEPGQEWALADMAGRVVARGSEPEAKLPGAGLYLLTVAGKTFKIAAN